MLLLSSLRWSLLCAVLCFAVRVLLGQDSEVVVCVCVVWDRSMKNGNPKEELPQVLTTGRDYSFHIVGVFSLAWDIPRPAGYLGKGK